MDVIEEEDIDSNLNSKFKACNWNVKQIDGHSFSQILSALEYDPNINKPTVIIANTIKGKGVSLQANSPVSVWNPPILPLSRTGRDGFFK